MAVHDDERWPTRGVKGIPQGALDSIEIVGIANTNHVPSVSQKPSRHVFGERDVGLAFDGDVIVVVDPAEVVEFQVPCKGSCLAGDAFHHAAVAAKRVNAVPKKFKLR